MPDEIANLILEHLRALPTGQEKLLSRMEQIEIRMSSVENRIANLRQDVALLHGDSAGQSVRLELAD